MSLLGFDAGNSGVKGFDPRANQYYLYRHALAPLSSDQWEQVVKRGSIKEGFAKVNGQPFAFGDAARRYVVGDNPTGATRYRREYYGVLAAYMMSEVYRRSVGKVTLIATHAPVDLNYADLLRDSALGIWQVESRHGSNLCFQVSAVHTCDEPIAGYANFVFNDRGEEKKRNPLIEATTLVVDVGGHTTDTAKIEPGGNIDNLSLRSKRSGVLGVIERFESRLRSQYREMFQDTMDIDIKRIEAALNNGFFKMGSSNLDCAEIARQSKTELINSIIQAIRNAGGAANYDYILLTGGGGQMVKDDLIKAQPGINFLTAEADPELMQFANAFGAVKLALVMSNAGEWKL